MKEPFITIPLSEYNEMKKIKDELDAAFNAKKTILRLRQFYSGPSGSPVNEYSIVNESELVSLLGKELKDVQDRNSKLYDSNNKLQDTLKSKKWYEYVPKRKWFEILPMK